MLKGPGIVQNWLGHPSFSMGTLSLSIRRMPAFFESFPVILIDQRSTLRADIAFRRSTCTYSMEESEIEVYFSVTSLGALRSNAPRDVDWKWPTATEMTTSWRRGLEQLAVGQVRNDEFIAQNSWPMD